MVGESNQNVFLIQVEASSFAEFEIPSLSYRESTKFRSGPCNVRYKKMMVEFNLKVSFIA